MKIPKKEVIKITHIITGLYTGGAEMMLYKLLGGIDQKRFSSRVISLTGDGPIGDKIRSLGVTVQALGIRPTSPNPLVFLKLVSWLRRDCPDIIQTWMYHADLIGGLAAKLSGRILIVWGIRNTDLSPERTKRSTIWTARICARLSNWLPEKIVVCSETSKQAHIRIGYKAEKMVMLANGFDLELFRPDPQARVSVRDELGIPAHTLLIGLVARFDPQKDHWNFIQAASLLQVTHPEVHYLLCGGGITWENQELSYLIKALNLGDKVHLLGLRDDVPRLTAALDIASTSSVGESFPNVVGEAMACAVPCVVTDTGDSAFIVGETGLVVSPKDPQALANAWRYLVEMPFSEKDNLGIAARQRVAKYFSIPEIVAQYEYVYKEISNLIKHEK